MAAPVPILTQEMTLRHTNTPRGGFTYSDVFNLAVAATKAILIPAGQIQNILYSTVGGTVAVYATISTKEDIEAGTAQWVLVTTGSPLQTGITAVYFDNTASTTVITLKVTAIGG